MELPSDRLADLFLRMLGFSYKPFIFLALVFTKPINEQKMNLLFVRKPTVSWFSSYFEKIAHMSVV